MRFGHNFIHFANVGGSNLGRVLAKATPWTANCKSQPFVNEIDLGISNSSSIIWSYDTTGVSLAGTGKTPLYDVLLHELGHAHCLNHVMDTTAILYYKNSPPGASAAQRKIKLLEDSSCAYGGNYVRLNSTDSLFPTGCYSTVRMKPVFNCDSFINNVVNIRKGNEGIDVYPNPADNSVTIDFWVNDNNKAEFDLFNMYGQEMYSIKSNEVHAGKNSMLLYLEDYPAGVYLLHSKINNKFFVNKIVHLNAF